MGTGPMTTATGRWVRPTAEHDLHLPEHYRQTDSHVVTDGKPVCGTWVNMAILEWRYIAHGGVAEHVECGLCLEWVAARSNIVLSCDMTRECAAPVAWIDDKGWLYCTPHGQSRRSDKPCRPLTPAELTRLRCGLTITWETTP